MKIPTKLALAEHAVVTYFDAPAAGVTFEDVMKPEYWTHVAPSLRPGHRIEVNAEDGTFWAMLLVVEAERKSARVVTLQHVQIEERAPAPEQSDVFVKYRGPKVRYSVVRTADNEVLKDGFQTERAAQEWITNRDRAA